MTPQEAVIKFDLQGGDYIRINDDKLAEVILIGISTLLISVNGENIRYFYSGKPETLYPGIEYLNIKYKLTKQHNPEYFL